MRRQRLAAVAALLLLPGTRAGAHRLDEYLQATTFSLEKVRVRAEIRLTPGVAVAKTVLAAIDTTADGVLSQAEQRAYAARVLRDVSLTVDGVRLRPRLVSWNFAKLEPMRAGRGDIVLRIAADVPPVPAGTPGNSPGSTPGNTGRGTGGKSHRLTFKNHHRSPIAVYLVNCLVPSDSAIQVTSQTRSYLQSSYRLDYVLKGK